MKKIPLLAFIILTHITVAQSVYETGVVTTAEQPDASTWFQITLENTYTQPIVIASPLSEFGSNPAGVRIRNVTSTSFEYQVEEFEYGDGFHSEETFSYLVIEAGVHTVNGQLWEAGTTTGNTDDSFKSVSLSGGATSSPVVFAQLVSNEDPVAAILRIRNVTTTDFELAIQEEEAEDGNRTAVDDIHYLAITTGSGVTDDGKAYTANTTAAVVDHTPHQISFPSPIQYPVLLVGTQTVNGPDPFYIRYKDLDADGVSIRLQEEQSSDTETDHGSPEETGYLVLEGNPSESKQLLWLERFSLSDGATVDNEATSWSLNVASLGSDGDNYFEVRSSELAAKNTDGLVIWESEEINISGYDDVKIAADIRGEGSMEKEDSLLVLYRLDGGPETPLINGLWRNAFSTTTAMAGGLQGSTVQIIVKARNTGNSEIFYVDNVRVFTESDQRYARQNGNWDDPASWSYTSGGASCSCIPDQLSNTHISNYTVEIRNENAHTKSLTVYSGGLLEWANNGVDLIFYGDAVLEIKSGGHVREIATTGTNLIFVQWNFRNKDGDPLRFNYPGANVVIQVDEPTGLQTRDVSLDAAGTYIFQGSGSIQIQDDIDINNRIDIVNNLSGEIDITNNIFLDYIGSTLTNYGQISAVDLRYRRDSIHVTNEGDFVLDNTTLSASAQHGGQLTNQGSFTVENSIDFGNQEFIIRNYDSLITAGNALNVDGSKGSIHNHSGAVWQIGNGVIDPDLQLFANYPDNEIVYNGSADQTIVTPQDAYWHLKLSNGNTSGTTESTKTPSATNLDINGNLTIVGTITGETVLNAEGANTNITIAGDWWQNGIAYAAFREGNETVTFDGENNQDIRTKETYSNFTVNKVSGKVIAKGSTIEGIASFVEGIVEVTTDSTIIFKNTSSVASVSNNSHIFGTAVKEGNSDFVFPIGDGSHYRPIGISNLSAASDITVSYFNSPLPNNTLKPNSMVNLGACGYWDVSSSVSSTTAQVTLYWDTDCPVDFNEVSVVHWNGSMWAALPGIRSGSATAGSITINTPTDSFGLFALAEISDTPAANNDTLIVAEDASAIINAVANDTDANGIIAGSITITRDATHGITEVNTATGEITYVPTANFNGSDSLIYTIQDAKGVNSNEAVVRITVLPVNDAPVAEDDESTTPFRTTLSGTSVLNNDSDPVEGHSLVVSLITAPNSGTLDLQPNGTYTYVPDTSFIGSDTFTYQVCDSGSPSACDTAQVAIVVTPLNVPPVAQPDKFTISEDSEATGNLRINDFDANGDPFTVVPTLVQDPQHGTATVTKSGDLRYIPALNFHGTDQLVYQVCDDGDPILCDTARVTIQVLPINDTPLAVDDVVSAIEGTETRGNVLFNDTDPDGDTLIATSVVMAPLSGTVTLETDGEFRYIPSPLFTGEDQFAYQVCDNQQPDLCTEATVLITIAASDVLKTPKGFSPNGDNVNDSWAVEGIRAFPNNRIKIFNRWGNVVYNEQGYDNINTVWRGEATQGVSLGGDQLPTGTYFYTIDLGTGQAPLSGYIILNR